jgi:hypothetical protein
MLKARQAPSRPHMAQRVVALALLSSFSACSLGGEPHHHVGQEEQQLAARAAVLPHAASHHAAPAKSTREVIRTAEAIPEPDLARSEPPVAPRQESPTATTESTSPRASTPRQPDAALEALPAVPTPRLAEDSSVQEPVRPSAPLSQPVRTAGAPALPRPQPTTEQHEFPLWPVCLGGGIAALSLLAFALLHRRDRKASQVREEELARLKESERVKEQERAAAVAREEALRAEQLRAAQAASEAAADQAAKRVAEQERAQAASAAASDQAQVKPDARIEAAHRLFDLLHRAERDVEPFLHLLDEAAPYDAATSASRQVVSSWHESILSTRNRLSEALARYNAPVDMHVVETAQDLPSAMSRLIDHAARMSSLMVAQQQENSAILHWSRQLPGALIQLFWRAQTARYTSNLPQLPKVPDAPAPGVVTPAAAAAAAAAAPVARTRDKAIQQALRGGQGHAVRT